MQHGECVAKLPALGLWGKEGEASYLKKEVASVEPSESGLHQRDGAKEAGGACGVCVAGAPPPPFSGRCVVGCWGPGALSPRPQAQALGRMRMDPGWGAAQPLPEMSESKGGGSRSVKALGRASLKVSLGGRIQNPNGRLVPAPGSAFVRLRPPCAEGAGGSARGPGERRRRR